MKENLKYFPNQYPNGKLIKWANLVNFVFLSYEAIILYVAT